MHWVIEWSGVGENVEYENRILLKVRYIIKRRLNSWQLNNKLKLTLIIYNSLCIYFIFFILFSFIHIFNFFYYYFIHFVFLFNLIINSHRIKLNRRKLNINCKKKKKFYNLHLHKDDVDDAGEELEDETEVKGVVKR